MITIQTHMLCDNEELIVGYHDLHGLTTIDVFDSIAAYQTNDAYESVVIPTQFLLTLAATAKISCPEI